MLKSLACALVLTASLPIAAAASTPVRNEVVRFGDLNLASPDGVAALERRIAAAARRVCGYQDTRGGSKIIPKEYYDCMDNALARASQQVAAKTGATIRKG